MSAAKGDLTTVYDAGGKEINACLYPQYPVLCQYIGQCGTHIVNAYKTVDAESGREQP